MATILSQVTNHTLCVTKLTDQEVSTLNLPNKEVYTTFYKVSNFDRTGHTFFYLAKGHKDSPKQICGWYAQSKQFWSSYGLTFQSAIEGLQKDGWMYA